MFECLVLSTGTHTQIHVVEKTKLKKYIFGSNGRKQKYIKSIIFSKIKLFIKMSSNSAKTKSFSQLPVLNY